MTVSFDSTTGPGVLLPPSHIRSLGMSLGENRVGGAEMTQNWPWLNDLIVVEMGCWVHGRSVYHSLSGNTCISHNYNLKINSDSPFHWGEKLKSVHWPDMIPHHNLSALIPYSPPCSLFTGLLAVPGTWGVHSCLRAFAQAVPLLGKLLCVGLNLLRCSPLSESILTVNCDLKLWPPPPVTPHAPFPATCHHSSSHLTPCIYLYIYLLPPPSTDGKLHKDRNSCPMCSLLNPQQLRVHSRFSVNGCASCKHSSRMPGRKWAPWNSS